MTMRLGPRQFGWMFRLVKLCFASALFITSIAPSWARAQAADDPWDKPLNLSHSGIAMNPGFVVDSEGVIHAVWQDDFAKYEYTRFDGEQWSAPETTDLDRLFMLPTTSRSDLAAYTGPNPLFIASPGPNIFAFWISPEGRFFRSKVKNSNFAEASAWDSPRQITPEAASFAVTVDVLGDLHLAYLRPVAEEDKPAGIYYTRTTNSGSTWAVPVLLYESDYLRGLGEGEANLSIATAGAEDALSVFVAWDNRPRKQVFLVHSADGGKTWGQPGPVAGPTPEAGLDGPFSIHVAATQKSVVLVWQSGQPGGSCIQLYQSSSDAGATWSDPQPMIEDLLGCETSNEFVSGVANSSGGPLYFLTKTQSQIYLSAWNGRQWSEPQEQPTLAGFEEPEIFTKVIYGCHRASMLGKRLYVIGCDEAEGGDVWVTSRDLVPNTSTSRSPVWSEPLPLTEDNLELESVEMVVTDDDLIHAFFSQHQDPAIYYAFWNGELWSRVTAVLKVPEGEADSPAIAAGPGNELFLIAPNNLGSLYFSRATSGNAATESRWSTPTRLRIGHDGEIGSVDIAWDTAGTVYVAYSVPVNEERGIYMVLSNDQGATWSEPLRVFDGAAADFDLVGAPSLLTSAEGLLHVTWKEQSIQGDGVQQPVSLYYARSEDSGQTFNDAERIVEEPVAWREIVTDGNGNMHLLWQPQETLTTVWDQLSLDRGVSWQFPQALPDEGTTAAVMVDPVGQLHLVDAGPGSLSHWLWDGNRWQPEAPVRWSLASPVELLGAAVNKQGKMVMVLAVAAGTSNTAERALFYSTRTLELPSTQPEVQEVTTQTPLPPTLTPAPPTPKPSSTPVIESESEPTSSPAPTDRTETNDRMSPFIMALLPVALLLLIVLGIVVRQVARVKDR